MDGETDSLHRTRQITPVHRGLIQLHPSHQGAGRVSNPLKPSRMRVRVYRSLHEEHEEVEIEIDPQGGLELVRFLIASLTVSLI